MVERKLPNKGQRELVLKHYIPRGGSTLMSRDVPIPCHTLSETSVLFPDVPHSWLDGGRLLRLHDHRHSGNVKLFQQQWGRAQVRRVLWGKVRAWGGGQNRGGEGGSRCSRAGGGK